ncbi:MAG: aminodeoxychorismate synthase component I [Desulfobacteraceae bacterium]|nr:aminodeoxychorismate synthase component I [Desulfobacteraceae bacterium]
MNTGIGQLPRIDSLFIEEVDLGMAFELAAARFAQDPGTVLLLSGAKMVSDRDQDCGDSGCARYNILALHPWLELKGCGKTLSLEFENRSLVLSQDPFTVLGQLLDHLRFDPSGPLESIKTDDQVGDLPVYAGLFGYFSYDLKDRIETLPRTCLSTHLPEICLYAPSVLLVQDRLVGKTFLCIPVLSNCHLEKNEYISARKEVFFNQLDQIYESGLFSMDDRGFKSSFTKPEYIRSVEKIIQYLNAGDIYQANLSQRFETGFTGDAYALFLKLFYRNPASFFSYIHSGDHKIVSTSPERFIKLDGSRVETRPIKGTIARGGTPDQDRDNGWHLIHSTKDDAELTMIVDLMRNDLSRVTQSGSVVVSEHKRLETYENVFHLVSIVKGELEKGKTAVDLLRATFPGGSITGCPKIRSMEIIDELEPVKRHIYTGSIGYLSFHGTMDLSIAIRTATIVDKTLFFSVGGGIVYDSDPEKEFQETLDKGQTLMEILSNVSSGKEFFHSRAWVDGKMVDQDQAMVSAQSPGFQYGAGLFETIRVEKGKPIRLEAHLQRMNSAWTSLFNGTPPDITWEHVIDLLIQENGLGNRTSAVKIVVSRDEQINGKQVFLAAFARPYTHRLDLLGKKGLDLVTFVHPRSTPLADHKTLNYLYYERAGEYARTHKADEALILNPDLTVSETNTCNLFVIDQKELILLSSAHVLPGVTLNTVIDGLSLLNFTVLVKKLTIEQLASYSNILVVNALMGAVRILHIDGKKIDHDRGVCEKINQILTDR